MSAAIEPCPFCEIPPSRIVEANDLAYCVINLDETLARGHSLIIPKRHVVTYFELDDAEVLAMNTLLKNQKAQLQQTYPDIGGFNAGINSGAVAGQTVFHCHLHLIPRRASDSFTGGIGHQMRHT